MAGYTTNPVYLFGMAETFRVLAGDTLVREVWEHPGLEISIPVAGREPLGLRGGTHEAGPGRMTLFNARERHTNVLHPGADCLVVITPDTFADGVLQALGIASAATVFHDVMIEPPPRLGGLVRQLLAIRGNAGLSPFAVDCLASSLVVELFSQCDHSSSAGVKAAPRGTYPSCVTRAKKVLGERLADEELRLDDVAAACSISKFHLVRSFTSRTGIGPMQYRNHLRVELAKERLGRGGEDVGTVAAGLGFWDLSTFNKLMRRMTGKSPGAISKAGATRPVTKHVLSASQGIVSTASLATFCQVPRIPDDG